jgi:uncharacterized protein
VIVVIDSGVWISALQFGGIPLRAVEKAFEVDRVAICDSILEEVRRVLVEKMEWDAKHVANSFRVYLKTMKRVNLDGSVTGVCRDPNDNMVVECAVKANAQAIVSGDRDLLSLKVYRDIDMLTPRQYLDRG